MLVGSRYSADILAFGFAGLLWLFATCGSIAADDGLGARITATCSACHRLDGGGTGVRIVGREPAELISLMRTFKADERPNHIMHAVSLSLSDDDVAAVAAHLAGLGKEGAPK